MAMGRFSRKVIGTLFVVFTNAGHIIPFTLHSISRLVNSMQTGLLFSSAVLSLDCHSPFATQMHPNGSAYRFQNGTGLIQF